MNYLFFDIECANCFDSKCKIIEFGFVITDESFKVVTKDIFVMSPGKGKDCKFDKGREKRDNRFKRNYEECYYFSQPEFPTFYKRIKNLLEDPNNMVLGYSVDNDMRYLSSSCERYKLEQFKYNAYDVQMMYSHLIKNSDIRVGLEKAYFDICDCKEYFTLIQSHLSTDDAYMTMKVCESVCKDKKLVLNPILESNDEFKLFSLEEYNKYLERIRLRALGYVDSKGKLLSPKKRVVKDINDLGLDRLEVDENLKKYSFSNSIKRSIDLLKNLYNTEVNNLGLCVIQNKYKSDVIICLDDNDINDTKENSMEEYLGDYILLEDFNLLYK